MNEQEKINLIAKLWEKYRYLNGDVGYVIQEDRFWKAIEEYDKQQVSVEPVVSVNFEEETYKIIIAGNKLAEAAHKVQSDYDGIHRLRLALAEWYKVRANEFNRDNKISD